MIYKMGLGEQDRRQNRNEVGMQSVQGRGVLEYTVCLIMWEFNTGKYLNIQIKLKGLSSLQFIYSNLHIKLQFVVLSYKTTSIVPSENTLIL